MCCHTPDFPKSVDAFSQLAMVQRESHKNVLLINLLFIDSRAKPANCNNAPQAPDQLTAVAYYQSALLIHGAKPQLSSQWLNAETRSAATQPSAYSVTQPLPPQTLGGETIGFAHSPLRRDTASNTSSSTIFMAVAGALRQRLRIKRQYCWRRLIPFWTGRTISASAHRANLIHRSAPGRGTCSTLKLHGDLSFP